MLPPALCVGRVYSAGVGRLLLDADMCEPSSQRDDIQAQRHGFN